MRRGPGRLRPGRLRRRRTSTAPTSRAPSGARFDGYVSEHPRRRVRPGGRRDHHRPAAAAARIARGRATTSSSSRTTPRSAPPAGCPARGRRCTPRTAGSSIARQGSARDFSADRQPVLPTSASEEPEVYDRPARHLLRSTQLRPRLPPRGRSCSAPTGTALPRPAARRRARLDPSRCPTCWRPPGRCRSATSTLTPDNARPTAARRALPQHDPRAAGRLLRGRLAAGLRPGHPRSRRPAALVEALRRSRHEGRLLLSLDDRRRHRRSAQRCSDPGRGEDGRPPTSTSTSTTAPARRCPTTCATPPTSRPAPARTAGSSSAAPPRCGRASTPRSPADLPDSSPAAATTAPRPAPSCSSSDSMRPTAAPWRRSGSTARCCG